jgi:hypothetical protein
MSKKAFAKPAPDLPPELSALSVNRDQSAWTSRAPWLIVFLVALFFGRVITCGMSPTDDRITIFLNPRMNTIDHPPTIFSDSGAGYYWKHSELALYIPVTYTFWFLLARATYVETADDYGTHLDPHIFHAASLLLHTINTLLVYWLLRKLLRAGQVDRVWPAFAGALIYGLHPLQVESVAWLSGMKDLLYCGFSLGAILAYLRAVEPSADRANDARWKRSCGYFGGIVLMVIGMLCKPTAMVVPLLAFILDWLILRRRLAKVILCIIPYMIAAIPLMIVAKIVQPGINVVSPPPLWERPVVAGASLAFYLGRLIAPVRLAFDQGWRPSVMLQKNWFWWIAGIPAAVGVALFQLRNRRPWLLVGALISLAALLPVLGLNSFLFQFYSTVADHYMVLAMLGPAIAVAGLFSVRKGRPKPPTVVISALFFLTLGSMSFRQLHHWHTDEDVIWQMLAVSPDSALGHNTLGQYYESHNDMKSAEMQFIATQANPFFCNGTENLVHLYARTGEPKKAVAAFHQLLEINDRLPPQLRSDYRNLPVTLAIEAIRAGHRMDVPVYLWEMTRMWFAENFTSWLGGSSVKYLPMSYEVPGALERSPHQT